MGFPRTSAQRDAIDRGLVEGEHVNIWAKADEQRAGERYCDDRPNPASRVTYHINVKQLSNGGWICLICGLSTEVEADGSAE